jgi:predicted CXXCH cytochrome family protein
MKMRALNYALHRMGGGVAATLLVAGMLGSTPVLAAGITDTKHNLGTSNTRGTDNKGSGTGEICVFCHTPHGSDTSASVPLWNKKLGTPADYTTYNSLGTSSLDGATAPVGSVSLACLSCHDGTQALNVMINAPGSGGYNSLGAVFGSMTAGSGSSLSGNQLAAGIITNLSVDLRNDHPVGIQYAGGPKGAISTIPTTGGSGAYGSQLFKDVDFKAASVGDANGQSVWWVDTPNVGTAGTREKTDMQLYTRKDAQVVSQAGVVSAGATGYQPFVECASCHDPHSANPTFLRVENSGSAVCLACHTK